MDEPKYEDGFRYSIYTTLGYKENGEKSYSDYLIVGLMIPFLLFFFLIIFYYAFYIFLIGIIIIAIFPVLIINYMEDHRKNLLIEAIAYEKKSGRHVIPEKYRPKLIDFETKHFNEIQNRIKTLNTSDIILSSTKSKSFTTNDKL
jgi:ABC-type bacteriocin/lantibiotic exporter with double-glycine peptidase domain